MKIAKTLVKAGVGAGAAILGAGALVYECALNTRVNSFFINLFNKPDPAETEIRSGDLYAGAQAWFDEHKGADQTLVTGKTGRIHAYIIPADTPSKKWAVCCHGYNSTPKGVAVFAQHYHSMGFHCVCPSMRGWGNDETSYCTMGWHDKDLLLAWVNEIVRREPEAEILLHGYSMGAVTVMLATGEPLPPNVKAAVEDCGFTACWEQFSNVIKAYTGLPAFPLLHAVNLVSMLRGNFDVRKNRPIDAVRRSVTPTAFLHGTADDFVSFSMMEPLYNACAAPKVMQAIEGAFHSTASVKDPVLYWKTVDGFIADKFSNLPEEPNA